MKIRAKTTVYLLPKFIEGFYTQEELEQSMETVIKKGTVFEQQANGSWAREGGEDPNNTWPFHPNHLLEWFDIL